MPHDPLPATARITGRLASLAFHATLPNGKPIVAHLPRSLSHLAAGLSTNSEVRVEISPYDLDRARIVAHADSSSTRT